MSADVLPMLSHVRIVQPTPARVPSPAVVLSAAALAYEDARLYADRGECAENWCPCADDPDEVGLHPCSHCGRCEQTLAARLSEAQDELAAAVVSAGLLVAVAEAGAL